VDRIARVREIIESNYALPLTLDWVARKVALRPEYLSRLFKKVCGANLSTYLREVRLEAGRKLIETTDLAVTRVARDCGFGDVYYFSASFRRRFGESPSAARRRRSMPAQKAEAVSARP
jgi:AraC family transcriptional regulator